MMTEVSIRPRGRRVSATRGRILIDHRLHVLAKPASYETGSARKGCPGDVSRDERALSHRDQLADRHAVARHDERLPLIEGPHDATAVVAQFPLGDPPAHPVIVAPALRT